MMPLNLQFRTFSPSWWHSLGSAFQLYLPYVVTVLVGAIIWFATSRFVQKFVYRSLLFAILFTPSMLGGRHGNFACVTFPVSLFENLLNINDASGLTDCFALFFVFWILSWVFFKYIRGLFLSSLLLAVLFTPVILYTLYGSMLLVPLPFLYLFILSPLHDLHMSLDSELPFLVIWISAVVSIQLSRIRQNKPMS